MFQNIAQIPDNGCLKIESVVCCSAPSRVAHALLSGKMGSAPNDACNGAS